MKKRNASVASKGGRRGEEQLAASPRQKTSQDRVWCRYCGAGDLLNESIMRCADCTQGLLRERGITFEGLLAIKAAEAASGEGLLEWLGLSS